MLYNSKRVDSPPWFSGKNQSYKNQFQQYAEWEKNYAYNLGGSSSSSTDSDSDSDEDKNADQKLWFIECLESDSSSRDQPASAGQHTCEAGITSSHLFNSGGQCFIFAFYFLPRVPFLRFSLFIETKLISASISSY
ncbi:hypothetical protein ElyMa_003427500 [Elysia marginata]|uniref:Uncharacterized protein n=1 Tax=Elysia marginata TaxID=1093978 RepID=A0AAV4JRD4_9GAST|nr:hypothetical protein ElyMa_003427500 [Elysia marginata]